MEAYSSAYYPILVCSQFKRLKTLLGTLRNLISEYAAKHTLHLYRMKLRVCRFHKTFLR